MAARPSFPFDASPGLDAAPAAGGSGFHGGSALARTAFYVGIPALLALYATLNNWKLLADVGLGWTLLFYAGHTLPWYLTAMVTALVMRLLRPFEPGLLVVTLLGSLLAGLIAIPYAVWLTGLMNIEASLVHPGGMDAAVLAAYLARATLVWVATNFVFDRLLGYPRYRYRQSLPAQPAAPETPPPPLPGGRLPTFLDRLARPASIESLLALEAEQHYVKVITTAGSELVLHRLGDAVRELPEDLGIQVHRSWWVSRKAIAGLASRGRKMTLRLCNGLEVPVSSPYQALVRKTVTDRQPAGAEPPPA